MLAQRCADFLTTDGKTVHDGVERPLVPGRIFSGAFAFVRHRGARRNIPFGIQRNGAHVRRATIENQKTFFIAVSQAASPPEQAGRPAMFV